MEMGYFCGVAIVECILGNSDSRQLKDIIIMELLPKSYSIKMLGNWNPAIFYRQQWILKNILEQEQAEFQLAYPVDDPNAPRLLSFNGIHLIPEKNTLTLLPKIPTLTGMLHCQSYMLKILELLNHTPVTNCGINYSFSGQEDLRRITDQYELKDENHIDSSRYQWQESRITRRYRVNDQQYLNLSVIYSETKVELEFNYHYELADINKYVSIFKEDEITSTFENAKEFLSKVFDLSLQGD